MEFSLVRHNETQDDYQVRLENFNKTHQKIENFNGKNYTWKLEHNKFSDWHDHEFDEYIGTGNHTWGWNTTNGNETSSHPVVSDSRSD